MSSLKPTTYVALLRGINVGGNNLIKMSALAESFKRMKFQNVCTYIQSGNVVFRSNETSNEKVEKQIEKNLSKEYGYEAKVVIRNLKQYETIMKHIPKDWSGATDKKCNVLYYLFISNIMMIYRFPNMLSSVLYFD